MILSLYMGKRKSSKRVNQEPVEIEPISDEIILKEFVYNDIVMYADKHSNLIDTNCNLVGFVNSKSPTGWYNFNEQINIEFDIRKFL